MGRGDKKQRKGKYSKEVMEFQDLEKAMRQYLLLQRRKQQQPRKK